ncbi:helix-turn-helix transcriptional regulator [Mesorhizobium sp. BH1-1-4]|uniref:helix-turn-helix transcriptional regulator n=1 Tax=Mesorhizobium sp. BH1-1-4 TaxID=2876662 RepID=UPI001CD0CB2D|nr:helix-turn-helix transcriptional regulator [Mesorhizobium sp. BH1-1-4]MBZ9996469.1 LuxR C-terminal-related transcriptional regulator [Mesorhizobium sp. BH1-1-4]
MLDRGRQPALAGMTGRSYPAERISELIGTIYDCVLDPSRWPAVVDSIRRELEFCYAVLGVYPLPGGEVTLGVATGIDSLKLGELPSYGQDLVDLWGGDTKVKQYPLEEPIAQSQAVPDAALVASRYFREWAQPQGVVDAVAIGLERNSRMVSTLSFGRHETVGIVGNGELDALRLLAPHFRRAIAISQLLDLQSIAAANVASVLDGLSVGVVLVDELMALIRANPAAEEMLTRKDPIKVSNGRVVVSDGSREMSLAIEDAVAQAAGDEVALGRRGGSGFPTRGLSGEPRIIHVLPLKRRESRPGLFRRATAALFIAPADRPLSLPFDAFAALYGLTPAEVRVAELIVAGRTQREIARGLGLAGATVKSHLLHVFEKTNVRRQVDLVRLVAALASPL